MKLIDDIRAENIALLVADHGGVAALAARLERSESQVSQWQNRSVHSVTGKPRNMKSQTARWIEETLNLANGWMDIDHSEKVSDLAAEAARLISQMSEDEQLDIVHYLNTRLLISRQARASESEGEDSDQKPAGSGATRFSRRPQKPLPPGK